MPEYKYTALKNNKITVTGRIEASTPAEARKKIRNMDLIPTSVIDKEVLDKKKGKAKGGAVSTLSLREKIDFTPNLFTNEKKYVKMKKITFEEVNGFGKAINF